MISSAGPFSPGRSIEQDRKFIDQNRVIKAILRCLNKGKSCSIIGGVGMGKTSILKHAKRMFSQKSDAAPGTVFRFIPIYFKPDLRRAGSLRSVYQQLIAETVSQAKDWLENCVADVPETVLDDLDFSRRVMAGAGLTRLDEDYRAFEGDLWEIIKAIRQAIANAKLLFLLDEMYRLEDENMKEALARHWFELLDEENLDKDKLRSHLAFIITCFKDHLEQFIPRRPSVVVGPIRGHNAIEPIYLQVFENVDAWQLVKPPIKETLDLDLTDEVVNEIYNLTGGHPLLLQSVMSDLWVDAKMNKQIDIAWVQGHASTWSSGHPEMYRWISDIISESQMLSFVFDLLLTGNGVWEWTKIVEALKEFPVIQRFNYQLRDALQMLISLGVVQEVQKHTYRIGGALFREWFEPLAAARVDEMNYRVQIGKLEDHIAKRIGLLDQYRDVEGATKIRERLKKILATLGTDRAQLAVLGASLSLENPIRADASRRLIEDVERIKYLVRFEVDPQLRDLGIEVDDTDNLVM